MSRIAIVPAAGVGSRLNAALPKPLVPVAGHPMIDHVIARLRQVVDRVIVIAHPKSSASIREHLESTWTPRLAWDVVEQPTPTGMLDAILLATPFVATHEPRTVLIAWCDQVGILPATVTRLVSAMEGPDRPALALPTVRQARPYIHLQRDAAGHVSAILHRREGDAMPEVGESDMGLFAVSASAFLESLPRYAEEVVPGTGTAERNFLPFIAWLAARGRVAAIPSTDPREAVGINTPEDLAVMEAWLRERSADVP